MSLITLTTDFGWRDPYAAVMKGVIAAMAPQARVIDATHDVPPFNVIHAAHVLRCLRPWYPPGTIHVAVVDPGVGTKRRILAVRTAGQVFLVPDNGVITLVHRESPLEEITVVEDRRYFLPRVSSTFHGRDIFAPVAAHLAGGVPARNLGRRTDCLELLPGRSPALDSEGALTGRGLLADRFGNLITDIAESDLASLLHRAAASDVRVNGKPVGPIRVTYGDVPPGTVLALIGSSGHLEIAVSQGSALHQFGPVEQVAVTIRRANPLERC